MKAPTMAVLAGLLATALVACDSDKASIDVSGAINGSDQGSASGPDNLYNTAAAAGDFVTLTTALQVAGLDTVVADPGRRFTVFAPTDSAFAALGDEAINALLNDTDALRELLLYHVLADEVVPAAAAAALDGERIETASGGQLAVSVEGEALFLNDARVVVADVGASNGVIHAIDKVLMPLAQPPVDVVETARAAGGFETLLAALQATGLDATLSGEGPFTVFAPSDAAFAALGEGAVEGLLADPEALRGVLLYHVLAGQAVDAATAISLAGERVATANGAELALSFEAGVLSVNEARVSAADIGASNGVIHVLDKVLLPPADDAEPGTVVDVARARGLATLVAALEASGLDAVLADAHRQFTVLAPTDAAFEALGADAVEQLLADPARLRDTLMYHVIADAAVERAVVESSLGHPVHAANGDALVFARRGHDLVVQDATLVRTDVPASNGLVHVIDSVLLPPAH